MHPRSTDPTKAGIGYGRARAGHVPTDCPNTESEGKEMRINLKNLVKNYTYTISPYTGGLFICTCSQYPMISAVSDKQSVALSNAIGFAAASAAEDLAQGVSPPSPPAPVIRASAVSHAFPVDPDREPFSVTSDDGEVST